MTSDGLPLYMRNPEGIVDPFTDNNGVDHRELRLRELSLPPALRMKSKQRDLRDAYLARMMLNDAMRHLNMPAGLQGMDYLLAIAQRENGKAQLSGIIAELESQLDESVSKTCHEAAVILFSFTMLEWRTGSISKGLKK